MHIRVFGRACLGIAAAAAPLHAQSRAELPPATIAALDSVLASAVTQSIVPGVGMAIVRDGRVVYQRAAGWADREAGRMMDTATIFYIASSTKAYTGLAAALLDRAGVIGLDQTLVQLLPGASYASGIDPARISVRQLLSHTHGISGVGPLAFRAAFSGEVTRHEMMAALVGHGPAPRGTAFSYSNVGYNILALAMDSVTGMPWQDVLRRRVFEPLGLRATSARVSEVPAERLAMPHRLTPAGLARMPYAKHDANMQAAGGIVTTSGDMARFLMAVMDHGRLDSRPVFPADVIAEVVRNHAPMVSPEPSGVVRFGYALGWMLGTLAGDTLVYHGGGFPGFSSTMSFMPAHRTAVVVLGNGGLSGPFGELVAQYAYALVVGTPQAAQAARARFPRFEAWVQQQRSTLAVVAARRAARSQTTAAPLGAYVGRYHHPLYGSLEITLRDGRIRARQGVLVSDAEVLDGARHVLRLELVPGQGTVVQFELTGETATAAVMDGGRRYSRVP